MAWRTRPEPPRPRARSAARKPPRPPLFPSCYPASHHISPAWRNGRSAPVFFEKGHRLQDVRRTEKALQREVTQQVEAGLPGIEVLAVELVSPQRFCVYID